MDRTVSDEQGCVHMITSRVQWHMILPYLPGGVGRYCIDKCIIADTLDETGVAAFTAQSRTKWAEIRERLEQDPLNRASLETIDSAYQMHCLDTEAPRVSNK